MTAQPEVRARLSQEFLGYLDEYRAGLQAQVEARVSSEYLELLRGVPPTHWIPFELTLEGVEAAVDVLGEAQAPDLWAKAFVHRFSKTPVIGGLIEMWTRLFGLSPGTLVKGIPRAFEGTYRNLMQPAVRIEDRHAEIEMTELAEVLFRRPKYFLAFRGAFSGFFELCRTAGTVEPHIEPAQRRATFSLRW